VDNPSLTSNPNVDPNVAAVLQQQIAIPYTTTIPTLTPNSNGVRYVYFDGTDYWLYVYANNAWRNTKLNGTGGYIEKQLQTFYCIDNTIAAGDVVSLLGYTSARDVIFNDSNVDVDGNLYATNETIPLSFVAPITMGAGWTFTIYLKKTGTPVTGVYFSIKQDTTICQTLNIYLDSIGTSYSAFTMTGTFQLVQGTTYTVSLTGMGAYGDGRDSSNFFSYKANSGGQFSGLSFTLNAGFSVAGLVKALDVPNNLGMQGSTIGIVESVDGTQATVLMGGIRQSAGNPYTVNQSYWLSDTTPGALTSTKKSVYIGKATTTSTLYTPYLKPIKKAFTLMNGYVNSNSNNSFTLFTGFIPSTIKGMSSRVVSSVTYTCMGDYDTGQSYSPNFPPGASTGFNLAINGMSIGIGSYNKENMSVSVQYNNASTNNYTASIILFT
jgi:hypothetical protein